ncbi:hypothetical protein BDB00DRAFT_880108 [Zychaea mexicana]|uniref:uncharacterized protein n=1 Tax=Zychaea mexicana TaxID=64656 RepID=UPI0022FE05AE|nr:uncharacterized protein BDB00DRAFT_880108 [Zychaea mexicana]KAI9470446.1 hypothetical protein BDB00DRAFT_880108 [Zychaea mexicana]
MNKRKQLEPPEDIREAKRPAYSNALHDQQTMRAPSPSTSSSGNGHDNSDNVAIGSRDNTTEPPVQNDHSQNKHDFINCLPADVVSDILSRLSFKERHRCMAICKAWSAYLSSWQGMWREIDICLEEGASDGWLQWIPQFETGHKIRQLRFFGNSVQMKKAFDALEQRGHNRIQSLVIGSFYAWDTVDISPAEQQSSFSGLMDLTGPSLVNLEFRNAYFPADVIMDRLFPVCKRLKRLICEMEYDSGSPPPDWSPPDNATLPCLTELLWSTEMVLPLDKFLPRCPNLRSLTIESSEFGDTPILRRLDELCPTLQHFSCTDTETIGSLDQIKPSFAASLSSNSSTRKYGKGNDGLRSIYIDQVEALKDDDIIPLIQRHHDTLEYLSIHSDAQLNRYWSTIAELGTRRLTTLDLSHRGPADHLSNMLLSCPLLEDVTLHYPVTTQIMDALGQLKQLKRLKIHEGSSDAIEGALQFAQSCSSNGALEAVNFAHSRFVTDHVLTLLGSIRTLRTVIVGDCPMLTTLGITQFIEKADHIERLGLYGLHAVTDQVMEAIGNNMERIQQLDISRCSSVTDRGVEQLISTRKATGLKKLAVQGCTGIGEHTIYMIEKELGLTTPIFGMLY